MEALKGVRQRVAEGDGEQLAAFLEQLSIERDKWLQQRQENEWDEVVRTEHKPRGLMEQFLGRRGGTDV
jgi:hypothetical protein